MSASSKLAFVYRGFSLKREHPAAYKWRHVHQKKLIDWHLKGNAPDALARLMTQKYKQDYSVFSIIHKLYEVGCIDESTLDLYNRCFRQAYNRDRARPSKLRITKAVRDYVLSYYDGSCVYCGSFATAVDHVIPLSKGGAHDLSNFAASCKTCNSQKSDYFIASYIPTRELVYIVNGLPRSFDGGSL